MCNGSARRAEAKRTSSPEEEARNHHFDGLTDRVAKTIVFTTLAKSPEIRGFFAPSVSQKLSQ